MTRYDSIQTLLLRDYNFKYRGISRKHLVCIIVVSYFNVAFTIKIYIAHTNRPVCLRRALFV